MTTTMTKRHSGILAGLRKRGAVVVALLALLQGTALANPMGPQVINGQASFSAVGNTLSVTNAPNTIINWNSFSINPGELTRFIQQSSASSVLNRVTGGNASAIYGALQSNGRVFLINQNGILFGPGAQVDVNGLIASTLNIRNEDFLSGRFNFFAGVKTASIENQGKITSPSGGSIYLIAPDIKNSGIISAPNGDIVLAAGHTVSLVDSGYPDMAAVVSAPENQVLNLGQIIAQAGRIGIYGGIIAQKGIVSADSAVSEGGRIFFRAVKDITLDRDSTTTASGAKGGTIVVQSTEGTTLAAGKIETRGESGTGGSVKLLGQQVGLIDQGGVDVSGATGGGTVLIGGDYQGENPDIQNARAAYVGKDTTIKADATGNGDGGKVIVWSDDTTRAYGSISARGGANGGNGGFVETSGHAYLDFQGLVDTRAPRGKAGTLLLDPSDITIDNSTDTLAGGTLDGGYFQNATSPAILTWNTINTQSGSLEIRTSGSGGNGDITIAGSGTVTGPSTLTLLANRNITIGDGVSVSGTGKDFNLIAGWNNTGWAVTPGIGDIVLGSGASLSTTGAVTLTAGSTISAPSATITAHTLDASAAYGIMLTGNNAIDSFHATNTDSGAIYLNNTVPLTINGIIQNATGDITITTSGTENDITVSNSDEGIVYHGTGVADLKLASGRSIFIENPITSDAGKLNVTLNAHAGTGHDTDPGNVVIKSNITTNGGDLVVGGGADPATTPAIGYGTDSDDQLYGIYIDNNATIATGGGTITMHGQGVDNSPQDADGISFWSGQMHATGGTILLSGQAGTNPSSASSGVYLAADMVDTTGSGAITIQGTGGSNTATLNRGVWIAGEVQTDSGDLTVTGTGGTAPGTGNTGVWVGSYGILQSLAGNVIVTGIAGNANSYGIKNDGTISGATAVRLDAGSGGFYQTSSAARTETTAAASQVDILADTILLTAPTTISTGDGGTVHIAPTTPGRQIQVDPYTAGRVSGKLGLLDTDLTQIIVTNNGVIDLGDAATGDLTINAPLTLAAGLNLTSGGKIAIAGPVSGTDISYTASKMDLVGTTTGTKSVTLAPLPAGAVNLGSAGDSAADTLELSASELNTIHAPVLLIGSPAAGNITVSGPIAPENAARLSLLSGGSVTQTITGAITAANLVVQAARGIGLDAADNAVNSFAGVVPGTDAVAGTGYNLLFRTTTPLSVTMIDATGDVRLAGPSIDLWGPVAGTNVRFDATTPGTGTIILGSAIQASRSVEFRADNLVLSGTPSVTVSNTDIQNEIQIRPFSANRAITIGASAAGTLSVTDTSEATFSAPTLVIGSDAHDGDTPSGPVTVAGDITRSQRLGLVSGGAVTQAAGAVISAATLGVLTGGDVTLNAANWVRNVAIATTAGNVSFDSTLPLSVVQVVGGTKDPRIITGVSTPSGSVTLAGPGINIAAPVVAGSSGTVGLIANDGAITGTDAGYVAGAALQASATNGITLHTRVASITGLANTLAGDITVINNNATAPGALTASNIDNSASGGKVALDNYGATTIQGNGVHANSDISVTAHSPLTVNGPVSSDVGNIALEAGASGGQDDLTINSPVTAAQGSISLKAGSAIAGDGTVSAPHGTVSKTANTNQPTIDQCISTPTLAGCSAVLPTLTTCTAAPTTPGCSVILPSLTACTFNPGLIGCSAVLPTLATCTSAPATTGCSAVLPTLAACTANPTRAGCSVVLPSIAVCTAAPLSPGCSVVLPTSITQPDQTPSPVRQTLNNLINETNPTTTTQSLVTAFAPAGSGQPSGGQQQGQQDDKKNTNDNTSSNQNSTPGNQNDTNKNKQYCN